MYRSARSRLQNARSNRQRSLLAALAAAEGGAFQSRNLPGLVAYYAFETLIADSTGHGHTLTNNGGVTQGSGIIANGANFVAASTQFFTAAGLTALFTGTLSISLWIKPNGLTTNVVISDTDTAAATGWYLQAAATGAGKILLGINGATIGNGETPAVLTNNAWNHVLAVFNGSLIGNARIAIWVNGAPQTLAYNGTIPATITYTATQFDISGFGTVPAQPYNGLEDEIALSSQDLSAFAAQLFNGGVGITF